MTLQLPPSRDIEVRAATALEAARSVRPRAVARAAWTATARLATGRTMRPEHHNRTTWLRAGDEHGTYDSVHTWWVEIPGWARTHIRAVAVIEACLAQEYWTGAAGWLGVVLFWATTIVYGVALLGLAYHLLPHAKHHRVYVKPLHSVITTIFPELTNLPRYKVIHVPRNFMEDTSSGIKMYPPPADVLDDRTRDRIVKTLTAKTGLGKDDVAADWRTVGPRPHVLIKPRPRPPATVKWEDVRNLALGRLTESKVMIGLGRGNKPVILDLENDSPHIAVAAGSGAGKSVLIRTFIAQVVHRGADAIIMDVKRISHAWAKGLPGIKYLRDASDIHNQMLDLLDELEIRNRACDRGEDPGRPLFVVVEELNATNMMLTEFHRTTGGRGQSPAVVALRQLLCMGRQVKIHIIVAAQSFTARSIGGPEARENFGIRLLSRYTPQAWNMLCGDVKPMPKKATTKGRWQLVTGGEATETQVIYMSDEEAQQLVWDTAAPGTVFVEAVVVGRTAADEQAADAVQDDAEFVPSPITRPLPGTPDLTPPWSGLRSGTSGQVQASDVGKRRVQVPDQVPPARRELISLRDALDQLPGPEMNLNSIKQARKRDQSFPVSRSKAGQADLFDLAGLTAWKVARDVRPNRV